MLKINILKRKKTKPNSEKNNSQFKKLIDKLMPAFKDCSILLEIKRIRYLARDVLITEFFVNRIAKQTKRPLVVFTVGNTGKPYVYSIKPTDKIKLDTLDYPSSQKTDKEMFFIKKKLIKKLEQYKEQKPVFIFVDASSARRMPSSFIGNKNHTYTQPENSLMQTLKQQNLSTTLIGYDRSLNNGANQLPKNLKFSGKNSIDAILFNPCKDRKPQYYDETHKINYISAHHDDWWELQRNPAFKEIILLMTENYKKKRFGNEKI